jgi:shikimate kinase
VRFFFYIIIYYMKNNIIYISGIAGSGKTTLGNELRKYKQFVVVDIDDLYFDKYYKSRKKIKTDTYLTSMVLKEIKKIHKIATKTNKKLVLLGVDMLTIDNNAYKKYGLYLHPQEVYIRRFKRELNKLCKHKNQILKWFNSGLDLRVIEGKIQYEVGYLVPPPVSIQDIYEDHEYLFTRLVENDYEILTSEDILKDMLEK